MATVGVLCQHCCFLSSRTRTKLSKRKVNCPKNTIAFFYLKNILVNRLNSSNKLVNYILVTKLSSII